jgi:hypothetical protein
MLPGPAAQRDMLNEPLPWWRILAPVLGFLLLTLLANSGRFPLLRTAWFVSCCFIGYAMIQDQFSAHLCPEYFTIGHPPIPGLHDPTLLGIAWGFLGGFPGGILAGIPAALASRIGGRPLLEIRDLPRPLLILLAFMATVTFICGVSAAYNSNVVNIAIGPPWNTAVPAERQRIFFIVACAHFGTYLSALFGGLVLCGWIWVWRRSFLNPSAPGTPRPQ